MMARHRRAATRLPVLVAVILSACADETLSQVGEVVAAGEHPFDLLPEAALVREHAVGGRDGPFRFERRGFPRFAILSDGSFIADVLTAEGAAGVAHIDAEGEILSWVATSEQTRAFVPPGRQLQRGWSNFGVVGDTVWFVFAERRSIILHTLDGEEVARRDAPLGLREALQAGAVSPRAEVGLLVGGRAFLDSRPMHPPRARNWVDEVYLLTEGPGGVGVDTVFRSDQVRVGIGGVYFEPFGHPPLHDVAPTGNRIVVADWDADRPGDLDLRVLDLVSGEERRSTVPLPFLELPDSIRDRVLEAGVSGLDRVVSMQERNPGVPRPFELERGPEFLQSVVRFPEYMPAARRILAGQDDTVWLLRSEIAPLYLAESGLPDQGARTWIALDQDGRPLFRVTLPEGHVMRAASREAVWTYDWRTGTGFNRWALSIPDHAEGGQPSAGTARIESSSARMPPSALAKGSSPATRLNRGSRSSQ
jgi:hypothetical protein